MKSEKQIKFRISELRDNNPDMTHEQNAVATVLEWVLDDNEL